MSRNTTVRPTNVRPTNVRPTNVRPTNVRPTNVRPTNVRPTKALRGALGVLLGVTLLASACNGGVRPTLVAPDATPEPALELDLPPAPAGEIAPEPAAADFPVESTVDDALAAWALDRNVPYVDSCRLNPVLEARELCDVETERVTVRLLGPSADEIWFVVTLEETDSLDFGTGYRVAEVRLAGS